MTTQNNNDEIPSTKKVVKNLMTENTGRHMLDSGSHYGRHFEENQERNLEDQEPVSLDFHQYGDDGTVQMIPSVSTYHFLTNQLEYDETAHKLTQHFKEFADRGDKDKSWLAEMREWVDHQSGNADNLTVNTYNDEFNHLDQVLQFIPFNVDYVADMPSGDELSKEIYGDYVILQLHNGCDVRGGYTAPVVFKVVDNATHLMGIGDYLTVEGVGDFVQHEMEVNLEEHEKLVYDDEDCVLKWDDGESISFRVAGYRGEAV